MNCKRYWWLKPSLCYAPMFMVLMPKFVGDETLVGAAFILVGAVAQGAVNLHFHRLFREAGAYKEPPECKSS